MDPGGGMEAVVRAGRVVVVVGGLVIGRTLARILIRLGLLDRTPTLRLDLLLTH